MPTYDYRCPRGHEFERFHKMHDRAPVKCPECGRTATRKISGGAGLVFKGSGFYITDYGKDGKGPRRPKPEAEATRPAGETKAGPSEQPASPAKESPKATRKAKDGE